MRRVGLPSQRRASSGPGRQKTQSRGAGRRGWGLPQLRELCSTSPSPQAFLIAFTSDFLPRVYYEYIHDSSLRGYVNFTLAYAPWDFVQQSNTVCRWELSKCFVQHRGRQPGAGCPPALLSCSSQGLPCGLGQDRGRGGKQLVLVTPPLPPHPWFNVPECFEALTSKALQLWRDLLHQRKKMSQPVWGHGQKCPRAGLPAARPSAAITSCGDAWW